jgi:maltooligosyltrehalose synthase
VPATRYNLADLFEANADVIGDREALVVVPRLVATLLPDGDAPPIGERVWGDSRIMLPVASSPDGPEFQNMLTGTGVTIHDGDGGRFLRAAEVFAHFPVAVLSR